MSRCFYEAVAQWAERHPSDAVNYFFGWSTSDRELTPKEMGRLPGHRTKKVTAVTRGMETVIHHSIMAAWFSRISDCMCEIRQVGGSGVRALEDLKWFCRAPVYNGGPKVAFMADVDGRLRIRNDSPLKALGTKVPKPRFAWVISVQKVNCDKGLGPNIVSFMRACEWQAIRMDGRSGLSPGDKVWVVALMMPGHHCPAPIQRIIRLRTTVLSPIVDRVKREESGEARDMAFWQDWDKRAKNAKGALAEIRSIHE